MPSEFKRFYDAIYDVVDEQYDIYRLMTRECSTVNGGLAIARDTLNKICDILDEFNEVVR